MAHSAPLDADVARRGEARRRRLGGPSPGERAELARPLFARLGVDAVDPDDLLVALTPNRRLSWWSPYHRGPL
jgi:hypothetical protein